MKTLLFFCRDSYSVQRVSTKKANGIYTFEDIAAALCTNVKSGLKVMAKFDSKLGNETKATDYWRDDMDDSDELELFKAGKFRRKRGS